MNLKGLYAGLLAVGLMTGAVAQDQALNAKGRRYAPDRVLICFKDSSRLEARLGAVKRLGLVPEKEQSPYFATLTIPPSRLQAGNSVESTLKALNADPSVRYAEPLYYGELDATVNDPDFGMLWGLQNTGQSVNGASGTADADIDADEAWDRSTGASNGKVRVAVIDSGVDWNHPDLIDNYGFISGKPMGHDYVNDDDFPNDGNGHGTHVAGTIGAQGNNGVGVSGVAQNLTLIGIRVADNAGSLTADDVARGIDFAVAHPQRANIINLSLGINAFSQALHDACMRARDTGALLVCAAGNNNRSNNDVTPRYPASHRDTDVLAVAACDSRDRVAGFSNIGPTTVDLFAPGVSTWSTWPPAVPVNNVSVSYNFLQGTSMATPHVAGAAALLLALEPTISRADLRQRIVDMVDPHPNFAGQCITGGRLNAYGILGDKYENDNTWQTAKPAPVPGEAQEHTFHVSGDDDWVKLTLTKPSEVLISTSKPSWYQGPDAQTAIYLYGSNPDNGWFDSNNPGGYAELTRFGDKRLAKGTYYIFLDNAGSTPIRAYKLAINVVSVFEDSYEVDDTWQQAKTITPSSTTERSIHLAGNDDWAKIVLTKPSEVTIETFQWPGGPEGATELYLYGSNPDGGWFDFSNNGGWSKVERKGDNLLAPGTYYVQVREQGHDGVLNRYGLSLQILAIPPPTAPSNLEAKAIDGHRVRLKWRDNSSGERGFRVTRSSDEGDVPIEVGPDITELLDNPVTPEHLYHYKVQSLGQGDLESAPSNIVYLTTPDDRPAKPENLTGALVKGSVELHWDDISDNEGSYEISFRKNPGSDWAILGSVPRDTVGVRATLPAGFQYAFRVRGIGINSLNSDYSNEALVLIPAPDLVASWTQLTVKKKGKKIKMTAQIKVKNQGNLASAECKLGFFSSTDQTWQVTDPGIPVKVGSQYVPLQIPIKALKPGEEVTIGPVAISVSSSTYTRLLKKKYLIGEADTLKKVTESDEENNFFVSQKIK